MPQGARAGAVRDVGAICAALFVSRVIVGARCRDAPTLKVYLNEDGGTRLVGRADVPDHAGPVYEVPLSGAAPAGAERFAIGTVTRFPAGGAPTAERAVLLTPWQWAELLPGWEPLAP